MGTVLIVAKKVAEELNKIGVNQIAHKVNSTGALSASELKILQKNNIGNFVKFTNFMQEHGLLEAEDLSIYARDQKTPLFGVVF